MAASRSPSPLQLCEALYQIFTSFSVLDACGSMKARFACSYSLARGVHACTANGQLVFLDLGRDRYFSLDRRQTHLLLTSLHLPDWATGGRAHATASAPDPNVQTLADALVHRRLLVPGSEKQLHQDEPGVSASTADLAVGREVRRARSRLSEKAYACLALARAARLLDRRAIGDIVADVKRRKVQRVTHRQSFDAHEMRSCVAIFESMRPYYPRRRNCLFDSLALIKYLAHYDLYPTWVFGVDVDPFRAHSWVQEGDLVLNDSAEAVRHYTPILAV